MLKDTKQLLPHNAKPIISFIGRGMESPQVLLSREAYKAMCYIVEAAPEEFGWFGTVERSGMTFLIEEVHLFEQEVSCVTVDMEDTPDSNPIGQFFTKLMIEGGAAKANKVRAWMHSHVDMGVMPSGNYGFGTRGDLNQMYQFGKNGSEYFIMGIANKKGDFRFEIFFYDLGFRVADVPWDIYEPEDESLRQQIFAEVEAKAKTVMPDNFFGKNNSKQGKAHVVYSASPKKTKKGKRKNGRK